MGHTGLSTPLVDVLLPLLDGLLQGAAACPFTLTDVHGFSVLLPCLTTALQ